MLVQSFIAVIESAIADHNWRHASGYVADVNDLCSESAMRALDGVHSGCFAFLAFDGKADPVVAEYVAAGSLAMDSGPDIMVLFTTHTAISTPRRLSLDMLKSPVVVDDGRHPAYDYVRKLAPEVKQPPLPCVVIFNRFVDGDDPVMIGLGDVSSVAEVRLRVQTAFGLAAAAASEADRDGFALRFSAGLTREGIPYVRAGKTSMREWLEVVFRWARANASTVVSILKLFV